MKLPTQKKILREDLKDAPSWASTLIDVLNSFMESVYQALNKNITFSENVSCFIKELTYSTPSGYPTMGSVEFLNTLKTKASGVQLLQIVDKATYEPPTGPVYIPWNEINGTIVIKSIPGLAANKSYILRLLVS